MIENTSVKRQFFQERGEASHVRRWAEPAVLGGSGQRDQAVAGGRGAGGHAHDGPLARGHRHQPRQSRAQSWDPRGQGAASGQLLQIVNG